MFDLIKTVQAAESIVPSCDPTKTSGAGACDKEAFFVLVHNVMDYAIILSTLAVTIAVAYGAFMYLVSAGEMERVNKAKSAIKAAVIGLVIVLTGWVLVNTVLSLFGCSNWNVLSSADISTVCRGL